MRGDAAFASPDSTDANMAGVPSGDLVADEPQSPKRPLVVDPESVLAGQSEVEQSEAEVSDTSPSSPSRALDSQGLLREKTRNEGQPGAERPNDPGVSSDPTPTIDTEESPPVADNDMEDTTSIPPPSKSWADVVDQGTPPLAAAEPASLPQRKITSRVSRRKPAAVTQTRIPTRKNTQPALVTSRRPNRAASSPETTNNTPSISEHMDIDVESRKRKDPPAGN